MKNLERAKIQEILDVIRELNPSDLSVLIAALDELGAQIGTATGSQNDKLWSLFERLGLAREVAFDADILPEHLAVKSFTLTEFGNEVIPEIIKLTLGPQVFLS